MATDAPPAPPAAPAPAAPAQPASRPAPDITGRTFNDPSAFSALDELAIEDGMPSDAPEGLEAPTKARDEKGKFVTPDKPTEKPVDKPEPAKAAPKIEKAPEKAPEPDVAKMAPKQLREAYEAQKARLATIEKERDEFKARATKPAEDPEKQTLAQRVSEYEKRLAAKEEELRYSDYSRSDEYKEKYEKPYVDAYMSARNRISALKIVERKNPETEQVIQPARMATAEDFDALMKIFDDDAAAEWATEKFGTKAPTVLYHRERVHELNAARNASIEEYRKNGSEREKQRQEQFSNFQKQFNAAVETANTEAAEKYPRWFKSDETDPKGNELLEKGEHLVARVMANGAPVKDGDKPMSHEELARAVSAVRNKARAFDRVAHREAAAQKRIKELEAKLAEYEASEPGPGDGKRIKTSKDDGEPTLASALEQLQNEYSKEGML